MAEQFFADLLEDEIIVFRIERDKCYIMRGGKIAHKDLMEEVYESAEGSGYRAVRSVLRLVNYLNDALPPKIELRLQSARDKHGDPNEIVQHIETGKRKLDLHASREYDKIREVRFAVVSRSE